MLRIRDRLQAIEDELVAADLDEVMVAFDAGTSSGISHCSVAWFPSRMRHVMRQASGRSLLAAGLAITVVGNAAFWLVGRSHLSYGVFLVAMVIAGCGAGLLNGQTVKVPQGACQRIEPGWLRASQARPGSSVS
jgi:hypothetical protein